MGRTRSGVAEHLGIEEVTARQRAARDPVERDRWQMIRLLVAGRSLADVAEATGYSARWVRVVVQRYNEQGPEGLADRRHANPGAAPLLDADGRAALETALEQAPPEGGRWTCAKVAAWIADRTGRKTVPAQRGWVYLRRTGHSPQVPRPRHVRAADPAVAQAVFKKADRGGRRGAHPPPGHAGGGVGLRRAPRRPQAGAAPGVGQAGATPGRRGRAALPVA